MRIAVCYASTDSVVSVGLVSFLCFSFSGITLAFWHVRARRRVCRTPSCGTYPKSVVRQTLRHTRTCSFQMVEARIHFCVAIVSSPFGLSLSKASYKIKHNADTTKNAANYDHTTLTLPLFSMNITNISTKRRLSDYCACDRASVLPVCAQSELPGLRNGKMADQKPSLFEPKASFDGFPPF
jgi:hypothetical protein